MLEILGGLGSMFSSLLNYKENREQKDFNNQLALNQFEYQKNLNQQIMDREDNAIQRRANDLREAGLNPLLAGNGDGAGAGGSAVGSSVRGNEEAAQIADLGSISTAMISNMAETQNIAKSKAETSLTNAKYLTEIEKAGNVKIDTLLKKSQNAKTKAEKDKIREEIKSIQKNIEKIEHDLRLSQKYGIRTGDLLNTQYNTTKAIYNEFKEKVHNNLDEIREDRKKGNYGGFSIDDPNIDDWEYIGKHEGGGRMYKHKRTGVVKYE